MGDYRWDARDYEEHSSAQQQWGRELIEKLALRGNERILDIGCGDGKVTAELAERASGGFVIGIDSSAEMVQLARDRHRQLRNIRFETGDAAALPYTEEFDVVYSNAVLHWVRDQAAVVRGICAALRPGGRLLLQMGGKGNAAGMVQVITEVIQRDEWSGYYRDFVFPYHFHGPEDYRKWLQAAKLRAIRVELIPKDMIHESRASVESWIRSTWLPYTQKLPEERRAQFVGEVGEEYVRRHPADPDGRVHVEMVRLEVEAIKEFSAEC